MSSKCFLCISDIHFTHTNFEKKFEKIKQKLQFKSCSTLYLLGDIVDEEFEYYSDLKFKKFLSQINRFFQFCREISSEVIVTPGNHDDEFFEEFGNKFNIKIESISHKTVDSQDYIFLHGHRFDKLFLAHKLLRFFNIKHNLKHKIRSNIKIFEEPFQKRIKKATRIIKPISDNINKTIILGHFNENSKYYENNNVFITLKSFNSAPDILEINSLGQNRL